MFHIAAHTLQAHVRASLRSVSSGGEFASLEVDTQVHNEEAVCDTQIKSI